MDIVANIPAPDECVSKIFNCTGQKYEPEIASAIWIKILQHKWFLSEKLGRDAGIKVACLDYIENIDVINDKQIDEDKVNTLRELGAQLVDRSIWDTIADSQPPKQIVEKRVVLPLTKVDLAEKHGVIPPKTIIFFGPPGTGKTHFVKAMAGVLDWWFIEVSPSDLMADGQDRLGKNLKHLMETAGRLEDAVIFVDEFEEIAGNRDQASRIDKSITNEFLKQVPLFKRQPGKRLLVCATNYIRQLDAALLRPGRFDLIIPVGGLDAEGQRTIFEHYLSKTNAGEVDVEKLVSLMPLFTPADIEYLFQKVTQKAFERELQAGTDYRLNTEIFLEALLEIKPSLTEEISAMFEKDCRNFTRC
jgi:SpoVK/Ycf46/Vps4 family AAA+-type ATPase